MKTCIKTECDICTRLEDLKGYSNLSLFCAWCNEEILDQSESRYTQKGNMCDSCNSKIVRKLENDNKIERIERLEMKIKDKNNDIELTEEILDQDISDKDRILLEKRLVIFKSELQKLQAELRYI